MYGFINASIPFGIMRRLQTTISLQTLGCIEYVCVSMCVDLCASMNVCMLCAYTRVIFIRWEMSYLAHLSPLPNINYIRAVIYGQITVCKIHYFLMETGLGRDPSACIMVGLGLTTSFVSIQLTCHNQGGGGVCVGVGGEGD